MAKNFLNTVIILLISCVFYSNAIADPAPFPGFRAIYTVSLRGFKVGESLRQLRKNNDGSYTFSNNTRSSIPLLNLELIESTTGTWHKDRYVPTHYVYDYKNFTDHDRNDLTFNWKTKQIIDNQTEKPWKTSLSDKLHDGLSYQLALRLAISQGKSDVDYEILDHDDETKDYHFTVSGHEKLKTPMGEFDTIVVERKKKNRVTTFWVAPKLDYLLVRIRQSRKDSILADAEIRAYKVYNKE